VRIVPTFYPPIEPSQLVMAIGDSLQFQAHYVDVDDMPTTETPSATWISSNAAMVSVSASGLATGVHAGSSTIIGSTADGLDSAFVIVSTAIAGLPATIRFAHAVPGAGPVTFFPSKDAPVTLSFGESVERPVLSGLFHAKIAWLPDGNGGYRASYEDYPQIIRGGDRLELYAVKTPPGLVVGGDMVLLPAWTRATTVPSDSGLVRFIQSSPFPVLYVRPPGALASGIPIHCYFDPGDLTEYAPLGAGDFDVILKNKGILSPELARIRATAPGGRAATYVIVGDFPATVQVVTFSDP